MQKALSEWRNSGSVTTARITFPFSRWAALSRYRVTALTGPSLFLHQASPRSPEEVMTTQFVLHWSRHTRNTARSRKGTALFFLDALCSCLPSERWFPSGESDSTATGPREDVVSAAAQALSARRIVTVRLRCGRRSGRCERHGRSPMRLLAAAAAAGRRRRRVPRRSWVGVLRSL